MIYREYPTKHGRIISIVMTDNEKKPYAVKIDNNLHISYRTRRQAKAEVKRLLKRF